MSLRNIFCGFLSDVGWEHDKNGEKKDSARECQQVFSCKVVDSNFLRLHRLFPTRDVKMNSQSHSPLSPTNFTNQKNRHLSIGEDSLKIERSNGTPRPD